LLLQFQVVSFFQFLKATLNISTLRS
jgi:hypothetical protein